MNITNGLTNRLVARNDAIEIGRQMRTDLPLLAKEHPSTDSGRSEYTRAIWHFFAKLRERYDWGFSPATCPKGGRAQGEYLTDFALYDDRLGFRIACESEWGDIDSIQWAFDKLKAVKADLKILIFQFSHKSSEGLPELINTLLKRALAHCAHPHPGHEVYIFLQFDGPESRLFYWEPFDVGPFGEGQIEIERID